MLRWSSQETNTLLDMAGVADPEFDPLISGGRALVRFVDAVLGAGDVTAAREAVEAEVGTAGAARAALVMGNFEMMNRLADGVGIPVGPARLAAEGELIATLGMEGIIH